MQQKEEAKKNEVPRCVGMIYSHGVNCNTKAQDNSVTTVRVFRAGRKVWTRYETVFTHGAGEITGTVGECSLLNTGYFNTDPRVTSARGEKRVSKQLDNLAEVFNCKGIYTGLNIRCFEDI